MMQILGVLEVDPPLRSKRILRVGQLHIALLSTAASVSNYSQLDRHQNKGRLATSLYQTFAGAVVRC